MTIHHRSISYLLLMLGTLIFAACESQLNLGTESTSTLKVNRLRAPIEATYGDKIILAPGSLAQYDDFSIALSDITEVGQNHLAKVAGKHLRYQLQLPSGQKIGNLVLSPEHFNNPRQFTIGKQHFYMHRNTRLYSITINKPVNQLAYNESVH